MAPLKFGSCKAALILTIFLMLCLLPSPVSADSPYRSISKKPPAKAPRIILANSSKDFEHGLSLNSVPGLPSLISLNYKDSSDLMHARILLVLDHTLLVVPLHYSSTSRSFTASFPTPKQSLSYQFQLVFADRTSVMSESFAADMKCQSSNTYHSQKEAYRDQHSLVEQAVELKKENVIMSYLLNSIEALLSENAR